MLLLVSRLGGCNHFTEIVWAVCHFLGSLHYRAVQQGRQLETAPYPAKKIQGVRVVWRSQSLKY